MKVNKKGGEESEEKRFKASIQLPNVGGNYGNTFGGSGLHWF